MSLWATNVRRSDLKNSSWFVPFGVNLNHFGPYSMIFVDNQGEESIPVGGEMWKVNLSTQELVLIVVGVEFPGINQLLDSPLDWLVNELHREWISERWRGTLNFLTRDVKLEIQVGSDWSQMGAIWDFLRSFSVHFGSPTQFRFQIWHHCSLW